MSGRLRQLIRQLINRPAVFQKIPLRFYHPSHAEDDPTCKCLMLLELEFSPRKHWVDPTVKQEQGE